jgi:hypothetical protein
MAFGFGKLAVLESKLDIYEDLSKEMLDKLERAVTTISDNSNKIAIVLERHENRLEEGDKANQAIIQMIKDYQKYDDRMFKNIGEKMEALDKKVDRNSKFVIGATAVLATIVTLLQVLPPIIRVLTPGNLSASMGETHFVHASR